MSCTENVVVQSSRLLTVKETMVILRIGRTKTYEMISAGHLEVLKFGRRTIRVKADSIEKLIANGIAA